MSLFLYLAVEPVLPPEPDGRSDAVGGTREIGTGVGLHHTLQGPRPGDPSLDADVASRAGVAAATDEARFEHHPASLLLRLDLRGHQHQPQEQQLPHRDLSEPGCSGTKPKRWRQRKQGRMGRPVALDHEGSSGESSSNGDARRSDRRLDGERLLRRFEAALNSLPARIVGAGATPGRRAASCENTLAAMPHQALWAGGRYRHGRCGPSGNGRPGREAARHRGASGWTEGRM